MKKTYFAMVLALVLTLSIAASAAPLANNYINKLEYKGFGVVQAELKRNADWYNDAKVVITDAEGTELNWMYLGGEEDDFYLRSAEIQDGASYTLNFTLGSDSQTLVFEANTGLEYRIDANGNSETRQENDRCDSCGSRDHDEDFCPERINAADLPEDADADFLARLFDIERCDRCNGMGHDDDRCPNR